MSSASNTSQQRAYALYKRLLVEVGQKPDWDRWQAHLRELKRIWRPVAEAQAQLEHQQERNRALERRILAERTVCDVYRRRLNRAISELVVHLGLTGSAAKTFIDERTKRP